MGRKIYDEDLRLNLILNGQGLASGSAKMVAELGKMEHEMIALENKANKPVFNALRRRGAAHQIEEVGAKLRAMMPWIGKNKIVDKSKN